MGGRIDLSNNIWVHNYYIGRYKRKCGNGELSVRVMESLIFCVRGVCVCVCVCIIKLKGGVGKNQRALAAQREVAKEGKI